MNSGWLGRGGGELWDGCSLELSSEPWGTYGVRTRSPPCTYPQVPVTLKVRVLKEKGTCWASTSCLWAVPPGLSNLRMVSLQGQSQVHQAERCHPFPSGYHTAMKDALAWLEKLGESLPGPRAKTQH